MRRHSAKVVQLVQLAVGDDFRQDSGHCPGLAIQNTSCYSASDKKLQKSRDDYFGSVILDIVLLLCVSIGACRFDLRLFFIALFRGP